MDVTGIEILSASSLYLNGCVKTGIILSFLYFTQTEGNRKMLGN
jgi:hypothetical protein